MKTIPIDIQKIPHFCKKWGIKELSFFGSILREDFSHSSDVDILIDFEPEKKISLFDLVKIKNELEASLGRKIDLVTKKGLESSQNQIRKDEILNHSQTIYG